MSSRTAVLLTALITVSWATNLVADSAGGGEYAKHFGALRQLSIAVAKAMPADQYGFKPHPESMTFGELMAHIATANYQFCAGLNDVAPRSCLRRRRRTDT